MSFITKSALSETYSHNTPALYSSSEDHSASAQKQVPVLPPLVTKGEWYYQELARHPIIYHETYAPRCSFTLENSLNQIPSGLTRIERPVGVRGIHQNGNSGHMHPHNPFLSNSKHAAGLGSYVPYIPYGFNVRPMWKMTCPVKSSSNTVPLLNTQSSKPKLDPVIVPSDILEDNCPFHELNNSIEECKRAEKPNRNEVISSPGNDDTTHGNELIIDEDHSNSELDSGIHSMQTNSMKSLLSLQEVYEEHFVPKQVLKTSFPSPKYEVEYEKFSNNEVYDQKKNITSFKKLASPTILKSPNYVIREEDSGLVDKSKFETPSILRARCNHGRIFSDVVNDCSVIEHSDESDDDSNCEKNNANLEFNKFVVPDNNLNPTVESIEDGDIQPLDNYVNKSYDGSNCVNKESVCKPVRSSTPFEGVPQLLENNDEDLKKVGDPDSHDSSASVFENEDDDLNACKDDLRERGLEETEIILTCETNESDDIDNNEEETKSSLSSDGEERELEIPPDVNESNSARCSVKTDKHALTLSSKITDPVNHACLSKKSVQLEMNETVSSPFDDVSSLYSERKKESGSSMAEEKSTDQNELRNENVNTDKKKSINVAEIVTDNENMAKDNNKISNNQMTSFSPWQPWAKETINVDHCNNSGKNDLEIYKKSQSDSIAFMNTNSNVKSKFPINNISECFSDNRKEENKTFYSSVYYHMNNISTERRHVHSVNADKNELPILSNSMLAGIVPEVDDDQKIEPDQNMYPYVYSNHGKILPSLERVKCQQPIDRSSQNSISNSNGVSQSNSVASLPPLAMFKRATPSELQMWTSLNSINNDQYQKSVVTKQNSTPQEYHNNVFNAPILTKTLTETSIQSKITIEKIYQDQNVNDFVPKKNISDCSQIIEHPQRSPDVTHNVESQQEHHMKKNTKSLNPLAVYYMSEWFDKHQNYPYPTTTEKKFFAKAGGISLAQVSSWFANKRARMCVRGKKQSPLLIYPKPASPNLQSSSMFSSNCNTAKGCSSPVFAMPNSYRALSGKENDTHIRENLMKESLLKKTSINKHKRGLSDVSNLNGGWNSSPEVEYNIRASKKQRITSE